MFSPAKQTFSIHKKCESGFTLIELMIALFVFTLGALAVTAMCLLSIQGNALVNRMTQANLLAQDKMEELISSQDLSALLDGTDAVNWSGNAAGSYTRTWTVADNTPADETKWLRVTVVWDDSRGSHQVELRSRARGN